MVYNSTYDNDEFRRDKTCLARKLKRKRKDDFKNERRQANVE